MTAVPQVGEALGTATEIHPADLEASPGMQRLRRPAEKTSSSDVAIESIALETLPIDSSDGNAVRVVAEGSSDMPEKTPTMKRRARIQFIALCFVLFLNGWDSGTAGPLIPRIQAYYHVNYTIVSLIFVMNCVGFLLGATMNVYMSDKWGFGKVIAMGSIAQMGGYAMMAPGPPFPVYCIAFLINGWGIALQDAQSSGFIAGLPKNSASKMGLMHALYGFGAVCSPFSATQFAGMPKLWHYHYLVSLGLAAMNTASLLIVFRGKTHDECLLDIGEAAREAGTSNDSKYKQILSQKVVHLLAFFILIYVGIGITIGGWTVTYMVNKRHGGASAGYVSTGFFGGLALGRVALLWVNKKVGAHHIIFIYTALAIGFELVVWLVPSLIGDAIAVSFVGFFLGPMYPIVMNETGRLVPPWLLTGSIGWIASFGFAGSALFPFVTGTLASRFGIVSLQPLLIILMASMFIMWALVPNGRKAPA